MCLIDMHCDTLLKLIDTGENGDLSENPYCVSVSDLKKADSLAQFFACFIQLTKMEGETLEERCDAGYRYVHKAAAFLKKQVEAYGRDIGLAVNVEDMEKNRDQGKVSAVFTVEEGGVLNGDLERLDVLRDLGVCLITLTWNYENCIGHPNSRSAKEMALGLKPFGVQVVERMNDLGMVVDVSHASDGTFWDVLKYSKRPVAASHSNCRALCGHPRNLSDEMIRALSEKGGVAGLNFYGLFLDGSRESRIDAMVEHIKHMIRVGGSDFPAVGTDFDGFDGMVSMEIPGISQMDLLRDALQKAGITEGQIDKIWSGNVLRVLKENV